MNDLRPPHNQRLIGPDEVSPIPEIWTEKATRGRKTGKAAIQTSSPYKTNLEESINHARKDRAIAEPQPGPSGVVSRKTKMTVKKKENRR